MDRGPPQRFDLHLHIQMFYAGGHWDGAREEHLEAAAAAAMLVATDSGLGAITATRYASAVDAGSAFPS